MNATVFQMPAPIRESVLPALAMAAPTMPPIRAWDELDGMFEDAGGYDGGDGVGGVVKAVHEVKQQGNDHQPGDDPESDLYGFHGGAQAFSSTMPSTILATSSQRSVIDSSCS